MRRCPTLVRVHMQNPLADGLHWRRADFGPAVGDVLAHDRRAKAAARWCCWAKPHDAEAMLARIRAAAASAPDAPRAAARWPNGAATAPAARSSPTSGLGKLRVLGTPRKQVGLAGFGLEVVEYVEPAWPPSR